jgi:WD40 repeat protein
MPSQRIIALLILVSLSSALSAQGQIRTLKQGGNGDSITSVNFLNDGKRLIASSRFDKIVMWDVQTGKKVWQFAFEGERKNEQDFFVTHIYQLALSPDQGKLALIRERFRVVRGSFKDEWQVVLISVEDRNEQQIIYKSTELIGSIAFSPDNELIAWSENDKIHLWNIKAQAEMPSVEMPRCIFNLAFSSDSKLLAAGLNWASACKYDPGTEGLIILNPGNGERVKTTFGPRPIRDLVFTPNGQFLIATPLDMPSQILIWQTDSWDRLHILKNSEIAAQRLSLSADGSYLAAAFGLSKRGWIYVWKLTSDVEPQTFRINEGIWSISVSRNGETLAVGTDDGKIKLLPIRRQELDR